MLYQWFEMSQAAFRPARAAVDGYKLLMNNPFNPFAHTTLGRRAAAACEVFERTTRRYAKPIFGLDECLVDGVKTPVAEEIVWEKPFCRIRQNGFSRGRYREAALSPTLSHPKNDTQCGSGGEAGLIY